MMNYYDMLKLTDSKVLEGTQLENVRIQALLDTFETQLNLQYKVLSEENIYPAEVAAKLEMVRFLREAFKHK
jgi:hypothetical protein